MMSSSSSSSSSATVAVEKATSDLLMSPDWTMNIDICDSINSGHWQAKDVVKVVKKRLQHKNPKVQLLSLTLLETMVKNCGEYVHFQIAERNILDEMIKIVKKKADMQVRDKILVLLDSWQEAFGGAGGKYPQYYWAYEELKRFGVVFPKRSPHSAPIFTPPLTHTTSRTIQAGYGMPSNSSRRLDETMATEIESLNFSGLESMRNVMDLLSEMLKALHPGDREAVKDEVIVDLVDRCRTNQKKLMQMLTITGDEELLGQGLELNDVIQTLLAKHDAIASGSPVPNQVMGFPSKPAEPSNPTEVRNSNTEDSGSTTHDDASTSVTAQMKGQIDEEDDEDEFAQLARRHTRSQSVPSKDISSGTTEASDPVPCNALALSSPQAPVKTMEQDIIDLLSITLSTPAPLQTPQAPSASSQNMHQQNNSSAPQGYLYATQAYSGNLGQEPYNNYVAPWAQPQPQNSPPQHEQFPSHQHSQQLPSHQHPLRQNSLPQHVQSQPHQHPQQPHFQHYQQVEPYQYPQQTKSQTQQPSQPQIQSQMQNQYPQYPAQYPPPPWAPTPGYSNNQNHVPANNVYSTSRGHTAAAASQTPAQSVRPLQHYNSFPNRWVNGLASSNGHPLENTGSRTPPDATGQKPFIPSYRLFEDLNVFGTSNGAFKTTGSNTSSGLSGAMGPGMVGGRK